MQSVILQTQATLHSRGPILPSLSLETEWNCSPACKLLLKHSTQCGQKAIADCNAADKVAFVGNTLISIRGQIYDPGAHSHQADTHRV